MRNFQVNIVAVGEQFQETLSIPLMMKNLVKILQRRVAEKGEKTAFRFYEENRADHISLSWRELEAQTLSIAALLNSQKAGGERVLLFCPTEAEFIAAFMACLFSGAIAVPLFPPRSNRNLRRIEAVIKDSEAKFALTTSPILDKIRRFENAEIFNAIEFLDINSAENFDTKDFREKIIEPAQTAFLQYTSGSTSQPKGVIVTHENLIHNLEAIKRAFKQNEDSVIVSWLPLFHDMGLIGNVLQTIYTGSECVLMPPATFLQKPVLWLRAISDFHATTSGAPTFGYELCNRIKDSDEIENLDLSRWQTAFCGAETVRVEILCEFARKFAAHGFSEKAFALCYGLAEATLLVSAQNKLQSAIVDKQSLNENRLQIVESKELSGGLTLADCGKTVSDLKVEIVNPATLVVCKDDEIGEIWISGKSIAGGYWKNEAATRETFQAKINNANGENFLRTGDLGFKRNESLFVTGRLKDLIIVRGRNYYPTDLEFSAANANSAITVSATAAVSIFENSTENVWIIAEADRKNHFAAIADQIIKSIAGEHDLRLSGIVFVRRGAIPKTSSGKIQRGVCRELLQEGKLNPLYIWSENELREDGLTLESENYTEFNGNAKSIIKKLIAERLGIEKDQIYDDKSLIELGIDSLTATEISLKASENHNLKISVGGILSGETFENLCAQAVFESGENHKNVSEQSSDAVSYGQQALYFLQQLEPENAAYNISVAVQLENEIDAKLFEKAIQNSFESTEQLCSNFKQIENRICRIMRNEQRFNLETESFNLRPEDLTAKISRTSFQPFDLENDCLLRAYLFINEHLDKRQTILLLSAHHIICDFWSLRQFAEEIGENYALLLDKKELAASQDRPRFSEFAKLEKDLTNNENGEKIWGYWREHLNGEIESLDLPTDSPRPAKQSFNGAANSFEISAELTARLENAARQNGVTLFAVVLAAYQIFLSKYSGQKNFLVGTPFANRTNSSAAETFGYFVNTLPIRADLGRNPTFSELLADLSREINQAQTHAAFPFSLLVERLSPERDASRPPLFQTVFSWQQTALGEQNWAALALGKADAEISLGEISCRSFPLEQKTSQFDLAVQAAKINDSLTFVCQYDTALFKAETIGRMTAHFSHLLGEIADSPYKKISAYEILSETEKTTQIKDWNATSRAYPNDVLLHELIEKQIERTPNTTALEFEGESLTYAELNAKANQLAHHLRESGVKPETIVGVALERSFELVIALLGIVKSGAAYLPLDPAYPPERFDYMLADARVERLITNQKIAAQKEIGTNIETIFLDADSAIFKSDKLNNPSRTNVPNNAAYVIYTSGSTGKPKGAINSHANIVNRLLWMQEAFNLNESDAVLQKTPFSFDVSVWEFFWTLMFGARLVIAKPGGHTDSQYLIETIEKTKITTLHFVPSMLNLFLQNIEENRRQSLKRVICSGEALPLEVEHKFFNIFKTAELHNLYGPTEAAIDVSWHVCERENKLKTVPIGKPIANTQLYVLDENHAPVPIGAAGELYIGGGNVGGGYLKRPALTAEKFIPDSFGKTFGARLYRTGDIVRYLENGAIDYIERRDGQIKLRGQRIELGEIQTALKTHPDISAAVVVLNIESENKHASLVAYFVAENDVPFADLHDFLQRNLPLQMIPNFFIRLEKMPLSPNGKLDRKALPPPENSNRKEKSVFIAPLDETQTILTGIFRAVLGNKNLGIDDNFFAFGGDSIRSIQIRSKARENGLDFELHELFRHQTVRTLAKIVRPLTTEKVENYFVLSESDKNNLPANITKAYPLTRLQTGLVFHAAHDRDYEIYVTSLRVSAKFDANAMQKAVRFISERHEILRTAFEISEFSEPLQLVAETVEPHYRVEDLREFSEETQAEFLSEWLNSERVNSFDWTFAPLARFTVHQFSADSFQITLSEPILDGWSVATLLSELLSVYAELLQSQNLTVTSVPPPFSDYVELELEALASEKQRNFWSKNLENFAGCLISDQNIEPFSETKQTERIYIEIPTTISQKVLDFANQNSLPLKSVLLAAHIRAISILTAQTDVATALLYNGRPETANGERAVGLFLNAVPFRLDLENSSFAETARKAFSAETELLPNRRFPLSEILRLHGKRTLFDTAFNYTHFHAYQSLHSIKNLKIEDIYASDQTYFPLTTQFNLDHENRKPNIRLALDYRPAQIGELSVREFGDCLRKILETIGTENQSLNLFKTARANASNLENQDLSEWLKKIEKMSDAEARNLKEKLLKTGR